MGLSSEGFFVSASQKVSDATYIFFPEATMVFGQLCILVVAADNITTTDGNTNDHVSVDDSGGNTWAKLREFTNGEGAAGAGATVSVWWTVIAVELTIPIAEITVTFASAITAKAVTGWRFGRGLPTVQVAAASDLANDLADAGSISLGSLENIEHLFIRAGAIENALSTYTGSVNYTTFDHAGANTIAGGAATNIAARGEFRILTGTSDFTDPTTSAHDQASTMLAIDEAETQTPVGTLPLLGIGR